MDDSAYSKHSRHDFGLSVVVCCFNSSRRITSTLLHLRNQRLPREVCFEVVIVDNNSTDATAETVWAVWSDFNTDVKIRVVRESRQGLSFARERGLESACYEFVVFVDDDNLLAPDYLACAAELMSQHPRVALLGGRITAVFEVSEPPWFQEVEGIFAVGHKGPRARIQPPGYTVPGAGMVLRKAALRDLIARQFAFTLSDRRGCSLSGGGDIELNLAFQLCGWQIYYDPRLQLQHFIPQDRLNWKYARSLIRGMGEGEVFLMPYRYHLARRSKAERIFLQFSRSWIVQLLMRGFQFLYWRVRLCFARHKPPTVGQTALAAERYSAFVEGLWRHRRSYSHLYRRVEGLFPSS